MSVIGRLFPRLQCRIKDHDYGDYVYMRQRPGPAPAPTVHRLCERCGHSPDCHDHCGCSLDTDRDRGGDLRTDGGLAHPKQAWRSGFVLGFSGGLFLGFMFGAMLL